MMITRRLAAAATIFSRSKAPPRPLMRWKCVVDLVGPVDHEVER